MAVVSLACNFIPYRICNYFLAARGEIKQNRSNVSKLFVTSAVNTQVPWPFDYLKVSFLFSIRVFFFSIIQIRESFEQSYCIFCWGSCSH